MSSSGKNEALEQADSWRSSGPLARSVNLLPLHPAGAGPLAQPPAQMLAFERRLRRHGLEAVLRRSGARFSAACGSYGGTRARPQSRTRSTLRVEYRALSVHDDPPRPNARRTRRHLFRAAADDHPRRIEVPTVSGALP